MKTLNTEHLVRQILGLNNNHSVIFVEGKQLPKKFGSSYYFTTLSGKTIIHHPNAYGWKTVYHPSTILANVGKEWKPKIPKGMRLETKNGVHLIRETDGMDFHFSPKAILRKDFCTWARKKMALNYYNRLKTRRLEKEQNRFDKIFEKNIHNTYVLMEDSRRAGNCVQGTLDFIKRFGINEVHNWFTSLPANILIRTKNPKAISAVKQAFSRGTVVSI